MILNIVFLAISLIAGISFVIFLVTSGEFEELITPLDEEEFKFSEIYGVGFKVLKLFNIQFKSKLARSLREEVTVLYGERYADYYLRVYYAQRISIVYLIFAAVSAVSALANGTDKFVILGIGIVACAAIYYYFITYLTNKIKKRNEQFLTEFPNAVSTIALLVNSGMILREAWREVSLAENTELYMQMRRVTEDMENGISEIDALYAFGERCVCPEIKKFTSFIVQGLEKGSKDLADALAGQTAEMWEIKKQTTIKKGELASNKLLMPLLVMFAGILIMVIGPIMTNLGI